MSDIATPKDPTTLASYLIRVVMRGQEGTSVPTINQLEATIEEVLETDTAVSVTARAERLDK